MEIRSITSMKTKCVECMCFMTLLQEHISSKHSHKQPNGLFELCEWQQAGYKQKIKWTLECDRCTYTTTSKAQMFEHIANHQVLEDTLLRFNESAVGPSPSKRAATSTHINSGTETATKRHFDTSEEPTNGQSHPSHHFPPADAEVKDELSSIKDESSSDVNILVHMDESDVARHAGLNVDYGHPLPNYPAAFLSHQQHTPPLLKTRKKNRAPNLDRNTLKLKNNSVNLECVKQAHKTLFDLIDEIDDEKLKTSFCNSENEQYTGLYPSNMPFKVRLAYDTITANAHLHRSTRKFYDANLQKMVNRTCFIMPHLQNRGQSDEYTAVMPQSHSPHSNDNEQSSSSELLAPH